MNALHDTDHLEGPLVPKPDTPTDRGRRLSGDLASDVLRNECNAAARLDIVPSDVAPRNDSRAHGCEIARRDVVRSAVRWSVSCRGRFTVDQDGKVVPLLSHRNVVRKADRRDARKRRDPIEHLVLHAGDLLRIGKQVGRNPNSRGLNRRWVREAGIDVS